MAESLDLFSAVCEDFGLTISTMKTEVMYQPAPTIPYSEPTITMGDEKLATVDNFTYLGNTSARNVTINEEVNYRIAHATVAFGRLHASVQGSIDIRLKTKLKVYCAVILPSFLYACETVYHCCTKLPNSFHMRCLWKLLHTKLQDRIQYTEFLQRAGMVSICATLKRDPN